MSAVVFITTILSIALLCFMAMFDLNCFIVLAVYLGIIGFIYIKGE